MISMSDFFWYVPHVTPNVFQQKELLQQSVSRSATELAYTERTVHNEDISPTSICTFEIAVEKELLFQYSLL